MHRLYTVSGLFDFYGKASNEIDLEEKLPGGRTPPVFINMGRFNMRSVRRSFILSWTTLSVFLLLLFSNSPVMAAQDAVVCPADRINSNGNICTASDVQLAAAGVGIANTGLTCMPGELIDVAILGTVNLRKGDRYDIGIWIASDGLPMNLRGGNDLLDPGNVPDEGGATLDEESDWKVELYAST